MNLDTGISTLVAILSILLIIACSVAAGVLIWQYKDVGSTEPGPTEPEAATSEDSKQDTFICGDDVTFIYQGEEVTYGTVSYNEKCWMDRNLGADSVTNAVDDSSAYGDLFQWGRCADGHQGRKSATARGPVSSFICKADNSWDGKFITVGGYSPFDWQRIQNDDIWSSPNLINNPCPDGWRVPTESEWSSASDAWADSIDALDSSLKLPSAGTKYYHDGSTYEAGDVGYYWSSTVDGKKARGLFFNSDKVSIGSFSRIYGQSIRCITSEEEASEAEPLYFGLRSEQTNDCSFVNVNTGEIKKIIPSGYSVVGRYNTFPEHLILKKDDNLFSYSLTEKALEKIPLRPLKDSEGVKMYPSISEKNKFFLEIFKPIKEGFMKGAPQPFEPTEKYFFNANKDEIRRASNIGPFQVTGDSYPKPCKKYDSKYSRFFIWPCGEGIGSSLPLAVYNLTDKSQRTVVGLQEFGKSEKAVGSIAVLYSNSRFLAIPKSDSFSPQITLINPAKEITKEIFTIPDEMKERDVYLYPHSSLLSKKKNTIVIGGSDSFLLLRFNEDNRVIDSFQIAEPEAYLNFIFFNDDKVYYYSPSFESIRVIDLDNWSREKTIPVELETPITPITLIRV